ncbi:MAG TPA: heparin lyase I family protein, partial [Kiloniellaceae bacterium]|nr:heparin lyase I family protein [Kiloniellaceae bacterium]
AAVFCLTACLASAAEDAGGPSSLLTFAAPRGEVIFAHHWQPGDLPPSHEFQGRGVFGDSLAAGKFLLSPDADGRYRIVEDPESGQWVLDILVTRAEALARRSHHTEIEIHSPDHLIEGRFFRPGQRYLLEWWRKEIAFEPDGHWEIWAQNHSMYDSPLERSRNPSLALIVGRDRFVTLFVRADSHPISFKDRGGNWSYTRRDAYTVGPSISDRWEFWQMEVLFDHRAGALKLWRNGELLHAEAGKPVGYNDRRGPPWSIGIYKYFDDVATDRRQALIGPIRVQLLE